MQSAMQHLRRLPITLLNTRAFQRCAVLNDVFTIQDNEDFKKRVLQSNVPVLVDFYADWCAPCRNLAPRLEHLVCSQGSKLHLAKINVDTHTDLAMEYDVTAVPAVIGIKNGQIIDRFIGLQDDDKLQSFAHRVMCH